jgi:sirohydrochlorin cobaltochelatase
MNSSPENGARALILFAHGSRDPQWHRPIEAVAAQVQQLAPGLPVRCAYLELSTPDLPQTAAALVREGCRSLTILPMFLGVGRHAREDLPLLVAELRSAHPDVEFTLKPAVGEMPALIELMARLALE